MPSPIDIVSAMVAMTGDTAFLFDFRNGKPPCRGLPKMMEIDWFR